MARIFESLYPVCLSVAFDILRSECSRQESFAARPDHMIRSNEPQTTHPPCCKSGDLLMQWIWQANRHFDVPLREKGQSSGGGDPERLLRIFEDQPHIGSREAILCCAIYPVSTGK